MDTMNLEEKHEEDFAVPAMVLLCLLLLILMLLHATDAKLILNRLAKALTQIPSSAGGHLLEENGFT